MNKKILLIANDIDLREAIETLLKKKGFYAKTVSQDNSVKKTIEGFLPHIIIFDFDSDSKPDVNFIETMRTKSASGPIPVILLATPEGHLEYQGLGYENYKAVAFLDKPFEMDELHNVLKNHL
jgi:DNA-binding response OmpR family regulator